MRSQALGGAHSLVALRARERAHQLIPASDHSAWTVPLVSIDPGPSDQRDGARESAHQTRARPQGSRGGSSADRTDRNSQRQRHHARVPPQESPPYRAAGAWRVVVTTSRHVPHSSAPQARRLAVPAIGDRASHGLRLGGTMTRPLVRHRPTGVPLRSQDGAASLELIHQQQFIVAGQRGVIMRGRKRSRLLAAGANATRMSVVARRTTRRSMRMRRPTRRCSRSFGCWRGRRRVKSSTKPSTESDRSIEEDRE